MPEEKYILAIMGMMLRTELIGKTNDFHLKHYLPMFNMYCILELRRGITIPHAYMAKWAKKRFGAEILVKTLLEQRASNMTPVQADYLGKQKEALG